MVRNKTGLVFFRADTLVQGVKRVFDGHGTITIVSPTNQEVQHVFHLALILIGPLVN